MSGDWVPDGYTDPVQYRVNETIVHILLVVLAGVPLWMLWGVVEKGVEESFAFWASFAVQIGFSDGILARLAVGVGLLLGTMVMWYGITVPIHEGIHYLIADVAGNNPDFSIYWEGLSPKLGVTPLETGITKFENLIGLSAPFLVIGGVSVVVVVTFEGVVAAVAAVILAANSGSSAEDVYHSVRILQLPQGTVFANFAEDGEIRTEYAYPVKSGSG